jgi:hypothetical protein
MNYYFEQTNILSSREGGREAGGVDNKYLPFSPNIEGSATEKTTIKIIYLNYKSFKCMNHNQAIRGLWVYPVIDCLPRMCEVLGLDPQYNKKSALRIYMFLISSNYL